MTRRIRNRTRPHTAAGDTGDAVTVGEYLTGWLTGRVSLQPSTRAAYEIHVRRHLIPQLGDQLLAELTVFDIENAYRAIAAQAVAEGRALSDATLRRIHATLTSALNSAVRRGLLVGNPAVAAELRRAIPARVETWTAAQLNRFLAATAGERLHPLWLLLAVTGMRRGEALGLRWEDLDLQAGTARISHQRVLVGRRVHVGPPKTVSGRRSVALPSPLVGVLHAHARTQRREQAAAGTAWSGEGYLFSSEAGVPLHPGAVSRAFDQAVRRHRLPRIRLHDLRHTSASLGLASGETLLEVSRRLGHSSITITADVYAHIAPSTARTSADRLSRLIADAAAAATVSELGGAGELAARMSDWLTVTG